MEKNYLFAGPFADGFRYAARIMFWPYLVLMALIILIAMTGCTALDSVSKGISEKSISGSGTVVLSRVGLDKTTQTPELFNLFVWGDYTSVVPGDEVMRYEASEDASIFNSSAKTNKIKLFFASGDTARVDKILDAIREDIKSRTKAAEDAAPAASAAAE